MLEVLRTAGPGVETFAWRIIHNCKAFRARRRVDTPREKLTAEFDKGD
jgi:hypothetical protein